MNSSLLSRNGSTSLALVKGFSDQLGTVSNFSRKDPPSSPIDSQLICACQNSVNKTQASCSSDDLDNNTILHCRDVKTQQGFFRIESSVTAPHLSAFVRINGPTVTTILFHQTEHVSENKSFVWTAYYGGCVCGAYTAAVYILLQDTSDESILRGESCVSSKFETPFIFQWSQDNDSDHCPSIWSWSNSSYGGDLSLYSTNLRGDYKSAYSQLRDNLPEVDFTAIGALAKSQKICMFGDSQMRNLLNSLIVLIDPTNECAPVLESTSLKVECRREGFHYRELQYPNQWVFSDDIPSCTHVYVNSGQCP